MKKIFFLTIFLISSILFADTDRLKNIESLSNSIARLKSQLSAEKSAQQIDRLTKQLERLENTLIDMASDISFFSNREDREGREKQKKTLLNELEEVLKPLLSNIKKASEKPRKIEQLSERIANIEDRIKTIDTGIINLKNIIKLDDAKKLQATFKQIENKLITTKENLDLRKKILNQQRISLAKEQGSVVNTIKTFINDVFKTKGKHIFLALLTTLLVFLVMQFLRKQLFKLKIINTRFIYLHKTIIALFGVLATLLSLLSGLLCLYFLNDWFLFTLAVLLLAAGLWSSKQFLPKILKEVRFVLNFGTVREHERLIWNGIPWYVKKIGFRCLLENKELEGGHIKLSIDTVCNLYSRSYIRNEPWFPTKKNDWVLLNDKTFGKVFMQTPEQVILELPSKVKKYYPLSAFLDLIPENLSNGFTVVSEIGLDYVLQKQIFNVVEIFRQEFKMDEYQYNTITIDFKEASAHSLNIFIAVNFPGSVAENYFKIQRLIQAKLVAICNNNNYDIPFEQLTVHVKKD